MTSNVGLRLVSSSLKRSPSLTRAKSRWGTRNVHKSRGLLYPMEEGLGNFLPPPALKTLVDWQDGLLDRLNDEVKGTPEDCSSLAQTVINTSTLREKSLAFNYASLALNNGYFLDQLQPPPEDGADHENHISDDLAKAIRQQHGSLRQLKSSFSAATMGMFTSGWVWFVTDIRGVTGILPTFGPGTLLIRSRKYMATEEGLALGDPYSSIMPRHTTPSPSHSTPTSRSSPPGVSPSSPASGIPASTAPRLPDALGPRFLHASAPVKFIADMENKTSIHHSHVPRNANPKSLPSMLNVGEVLYPLFCISVYEHAWLSAGHGVWGKETWLKEFWSVIDWSKVSKAYESAKVSKANDFS